MLLIEEKFNKPNQMLWLLSRYAEEIEAEYIVLYNHEDDVIKFEYQELIRNNNGIIEGIKKYYSEHSNVSKLDDNEIKDVISSLSREFSNIRLFPGKTEINRL